MTKRARTRGYLSQLAEPLPPGEPVLTARSCPLLSAGPGHSLAPVIEDRFEVAERSWTPLARKAPRMRREAPVASTELGRQETSPSHEDRAPTPLPRGEATVVVRERGRVAQQPTDEGASRQPEALRNEAPAPRATSSASPLTPKQAAQELDAEGGGGFNPRIKPTESTRALAPERPSTPISPDTPSVSAASNAVAAGGFRAEVKRAALAPLEVAGEIGPPAENAENRVFSAELPRAAKSSVAGRSQPALLPVAAAKDGRASAGSRVHIGTVEIRSILPQPPVARPIAAPPAQTIESRTPPTRAQSGAAEPLARGLSWSYGLVQG
jgi:hypothetical protein